MNNSTREFVLIVDDEDDVRLLLGKFLKARGYEIKSCKSLKEVRAFLAESLPDIVLLDINLEDGNGLDLLNESLIDSSTRIVVMSAQTNLEGEALKRGAHSFVSKPFIPGKLLSAIGN